MDIIEANYWYAAQKVYWGDGTGLFTYGYTIASSVGNCQGVTLGDVDGDSDLDLVTASINGEANRLYLNNGSGTLTFQADLATGGNRWLSVQLGDVDNDGDLDVVFGSDNQASTVGLNDGNGNFSNWSYFGAVSDQTWDVQVG